MTNYFSRLARTTGLQIGAAPASRAAPGHEPPQARPPLAAAGVEPPPHVEELTFVDQEPAPSPAAAAPAAQPLGEGPRPENEPARGESTGVRASAREESPAVARVEPHAEPGVFADERPEPGERAADSGPPAFFEESRVELVSRDEDERVARERTVPPEAAPPAPVEPSLSHTRSGQESSQPARPVELITADHTREGAGREAVETLEVSEVVRVPDVPAPAAAGAPPAASPTAQADARRAYLREVVEWITGPADAARELDGDSAAEPESSPASVWAGNKPAPAAARERAEAAHELEVQDFSLSIGSISIVVEGEPRHSPAPAPAHRTEPQPSQPAPVETSRLRRHYIRGL